jgi:hypothetical protein
LVNPLQTYAIVKKPVAFDNGTHARNVRLPGQPPEGNPMSLMTDEKESAQGLKDYVLRLVRYLPDLLEFIGTPKPIARGVGHAVRFVPGLRNYTNGDSDDRASSSINGNFHSILATQQQLASRCDLLEQENTKVKFELAAATDQLQQLEAETLALRAGMQSMRTRNTYLGLGLLAVFLIAISELVLRLMK